MGFLEVGRGAWAGDGMRARGTVWSSRAGDPEEGVQGKQMRWWKARVWWSGTGARIGGVGFKEAGTALGARHGVVLGFGGSQKLAQAEGEPCG